MAILPKGSGFPTIVEGAEEGATFQVEVSGHLMSLLAGLYSKREDSIVRETLSNAYDAQISIGVVTPVLIELPTEASPVLKFIDKGPGMAKDTVFRVFASYGTSSKGASETQTGGMGLGAKAVFCYTDSFTVISKHEGTEATYVAYMVGDSGIPRIDLLGVIPCDPSQTGIEVQIPIQLADIDKFCDAVRWNGQFHSVPPTVMGGAPLECLMDCMPCTLDLTGYGLPGWTAYPKVQGLTGVVMGSVFYPLTQEVPELGGLNLMYQVPMGAVRFAPSREALKYDEVTLANLKKAKRAVARALKNWIDGLLSSAETRFPGLTGNQGDVLHAMAKGPLIQVLHASVLVSLGGEALRNRFYPPSFMAKSLPGSLARYLSVFDRDGSRRSLMNDKLLVSIDPQEAEVWVIDCSGGDARLREAFSSNKTRSCVFVAKDESVAIALAAHLGFSADRFIRYTSALPKVSQPQRKRGDYTKIGGMLNLYRDLSRAAKYVLTDADRAYEQAGGVYVEAYLGGQDWRSASTSGKLQLNQSSPLYVVDKPSPWCKHSVRTPFLRLNAAEREKLKKMGRPLIPLADLVEAALDIEACHLAYRDWRILNEEQVQNPRRNKVNVVFSAWPSLPGAVQALLLERLNEAEAGLGDLLQEALSRQPAWVPPKGMTRDSYVELKSKVAHLPFIREERPQSLEQGLHSALSGADMSKSWLPSNKGGHLATILGMLALLDTPAAVIGRALCPPPVHAESEAPAAVNAVSRTKQKACRPEDQLSLFEGEPVEEGKPATAAPVMMRAAA